MKQTDLEREALRVLEPLRYSPVGISSPNEVEVGRRTTVPRLARLIEGVPEQRALRLKQRRWLKIAQYASGVGLALAAAVMVWVTSDVGAAATREVPQLVLLDGQLSQKGTALSAGVKYTIDRLGRLSTPASSGATFVTNEDVNIDFGVDSSADLSFGEGFRRIALNRGKIQLSVPKLKPGTALSVATPDAIVTVHGTRFSVEITGNTSCVRVTEGVVAVTRGAKLERLTAGLSSGCEKPMAIASTAAAAAPAEPNQRTQLRQQRPKPKSVGTLTVENRLFQSALAAEQSGNLPQAERLAQQLLTRFPDSPMAPDTKRILHRVADKQASAAQAQ